MTGDAYFKRIVYDALVKQYQVGHEDLNNLEFVGQRVRWNSASAEYPAHISVDQNKKIEELTEVQFDKSLKDCVAVTPALHTLSISPGTNQLATITNTVPSLLRIQSLCVRIGESHHWRL